MEASDAPSPFRVRVLTRHPLTREVPPAMSFRFCVLISTLFLLLGTTATAMDKEQVIMIQKALKSEGFYAGNVDGKWGKMSSGALQKFQRRYGLKPTGQIDNATLEALKDSNRKPPDSFKPESAQEAARHFLLTQKRTAPRTPLSDSPNTVELFVRKFLNATEHAVIDDEIHYFADEVDYFDRGPVSLDFVKADQRKYYNKWPIRKIDLTAPPVIVPSNNGDAFTVRYYTDFLVRNARYQLKGTSLNVVRLERVPGGLVITAIKERRLPDPPKPKPTPTAAGEKSPTPSQ